MSQRPDQSSQRTHALEKRVAELERQVSALLRLRTDDGRILQLTGQNAILKKP